MREVTGCVDDHSFYNTEFSLTTGENLFIFILALKESFDWRCLFVIGREAKVKIFGADVPKFIWQLGRPFGDIHIQILHNILSTVLIIKYVR